MALAAAADLRRLGGICAQDYDNRIQAVMSIRADAARSVADFEEAHRNLASHIRQRMGDLDAARRQMAAEQRRELIDEHIRLEATVGQMREELADDVSDLHRAYSDFTQQVQARRSKKRRA